VYRPNPGKGRPIDLNKWSNVAKLIAPAFPVNGCTGSPIQPNQAASLGKANPFSFAAFPLTSKIN